MSTNYPITEVPYSMTATHCRSVTAIPRKPKIQVRVNLDGSGVSPIYPPASVFLTTCWIKSRATA